MASAPVEAAPRGNLRTRTARGTLINAAFNVGLQALGFLRGFIIAGFLTAAEYGLWGLLVISLGTLLWLAQIGIDDKYIQQDHPDQEQAFRIAFTLQCMLAGVFMLILVAGIFGFAFAYDEPKIILPGLVLTLAMPTAALQAPLWVYYRKMDFLKQRRLALWDPITSFVVTCAMAIAGFGYWSLVIGTLLGAWAAAIVAVRASPYKLRFHYEPGTLREYATFGWPLMLGQASGVLIAQVPILVVQRHIGIAAVGGITLAGTISLYARRVDEIITDTIYPAIARVKDNTELLFETFQKSNRLALMWGVPCGVGIALFAPDIVDYVIGDKWEFAVPIIQIMALTAGFNQFGFNWMAFYKARGQTRPIAVTGVVMLIATMALAIPLTLSHGVKGYALGMAGATAVQIVQRTIYLVKLFPGFNILSHAVRAMLPTVPAAGVVLLARALEPDGRTPLHAAAEALAFGVVLVVCTFLLERGLIREIIGYVRGESAEQPPSAGSLAPQ